MTASVGEPEARMMTKNGNERPPPEPEIIPPGNQPDAGIWASRTTHGTHRIYVTRLSPCGIRLLAAAISAVLMVVGALLLGFFLTWILPLIVTLIIIAVVIRFARHIFTDDK
jgi:hypothetical protein